MWHSVDPAAESFYDLSTYNYCANNPLIYIDPNGKVWHIVIGAAIGGVINWASHGCQFNQNGLVAFGIGAVAGAVTAATGGAAFVAAGGTATGGGGFVAGAFSGLVGYTYGTAFQSIGNTTYFGDPMPTPKEFLIGAGISTLTAGFGNGLNSLAHGGSFWKGVPYANPTVNLPKLETPKPTINTEGMRSKVNGPIPETNQAPAVSSVVDDLPSNGTWQGVKNADGSIKFVRVDDAAKGGFSFSERVSENFAKHAFAGGRHADLGLSVETMTSKGMNLVENNMSLLKTGDNTLIGNINGIQKSLKAYVIDGKIRSVNMYPGVSNRVTKGTIINFGNVTW